MANRIALIVSALLVSAARTSADGLADELRKLDATVIPSDQAKARPPARMMPADAKARYREAAVRENEAWAGVKTKADWERFRDVRIAALRQSLGAMPAVPKDLKLRVTATLEGNGCRIENVVYESRPGLLVTANLYSPAKPGAAMPAILIAHSHHNAKTQGELQDMGMLWARAGCVVLVPDAVGHGERRQHPFTDAASFPQQFRVGRQDYYFRFNIGMQLHLVGESLMGWMVWDLMRGVDVLAGRRGVDKDKIILLGAVAGGGDPAGVTAALDTRIAAVAPFNFGGPQPDDAIPADAQNDFYWFGGGYWETTRCLRLGARDGFAHWVIAAAAAPRSLIYSYEFAWDRDRDPAWPRIKKVYGLYGADDRLAVTQGRGNLKGKPPESSHCNNIGELHRVGIHAAFKSWFGIPAPEKEMQDRKDAKGLLCLTPELRRETRPVQELAGDIADRHLAAARAKLEPLSPADRRRHLRQEWGTLLGGADPAADPTAASSESRTIGNVTIERVILETDKGIAVPLVLLFPTKAAGKTPVVVGIAQQGKQAFLKERADVVAALLAGGTAVCLPDVRGTGETRVGGRSYNGGATSVSQSELMLGRTVLGLQLRDLRSVMHWLRNKDGIDGGRVALWGDSFAAPNPADRKLEVPLDLDQPERAEPAGGLLALLGALYEDNVRAVYVRRGLSGYRAALDSQFLHLPHDALVPGVLTAGDLCDLAAASAPRPLRLEGLVDGLNRAVADQTLRRTYDSTAAAYKAGSALDLLTIGDRAGDDADIAEWLRRFVRHGQ